jgi:hypothetical protein
MAFSHPFLVIFCQNISPCPITYFRLSINVCCIPQFRCMISLYLWYCAQLSFHAFRKGVNDPTWHFRVA